MTTSPVFPPGVFRPDPQRASTLAMVYSQGLVETKLFLRHGEQQLLSLLVPLGMLFGLAKLPILDIADPLQQGFPMILTVAALSSGFTGQAISLAFDRRYGALQRTGASGVPAWTIITGKIIAVTAMLFLQVFILGSVAFYLGWRTSVVGALLGLFLLLIGAACFTSMGLLMGGTLNSEVVLALANLIWVVLMGITGWVLYSVGLTQASWWDIIPSVALASALSQAFSGILPWTQVVILIMWILVVSFATSKWFRFAS
ncbi:hypothetical protein [Corynebacterium caspium]|uniref:hypothetical protein n=1 Tax=Corynebacterium caspium TaxID=234828 RepID=UPI0003627204|nr:hypothetical protein [Corynebacterium caspium]WKD59261.1 ABC-2 family transporter protein [Corynebacterium caspium DSM 44850]